MLQSIHSNSRKSSGDQHEYSPQRESPRSVNPPSRKVSHEALSRNSALNERYFDIEKVRSRSLDNLLSEPEPTPLTDLGLSQSKLNERYHSVEQLNAPIKPVLANSNYMSKQQEIEFEYPDVSSISTSNRGGPRYIKSQYSGKKAPPGSHSSRAQIEKSEFVVRSSAMSDTSEAPSLASHVRRVRVPSQASDVDQFLDELFSPVLDGNLDELSDARSLAASIKGGNQNMYDNSSYLEQFFDDIFDCLDDDETKMSDAEYLISKIKGGGHHHNSPVSQNSSLLDKEVENLTSQKNEIGQEKNNGDVDDYISDLFRPIFINDSLKALTEKHNLVDSIKGGGTTHQPGGSGTSAYNFPTMGTPLVNSPPLMMPMLSSPQESFMPMFNMNGIAMTPNASADIASYQQNLQRAFLQSAMAQNIQIQQQLLAQNQALQQLLTQQATTEIKTVSDVIQTTTAKAQVHEHPSHLSPQRKGSLKGNGALRRSSSPSDYKSRRTSSESNVSVINRNNGVPPPPPMPPPLHDGDPSEARPFMDPYGRAKTVRIGKWRWPPPKDDNIPTNGEDFMHFKFRQNQRKITPSKDGPVMVLNGHSNANSAPHSTSQSSAEWEELDFEPVVREPEKATKVNTKRSFEVGAARPSPGSVGKLKLSSEMRQRLELVTANHSVRSTSSKIEKPARTVNKLEDTRKMMLEQQLAGRWGSESVDENDTYSGPPSPVTPAQVRAQRDSKSPTQQNWTGSNWKPGPPPPPIGPSSLPPAPTVPAPPPPIRPQQQPPTPVEPVRESFISQRQDRDTFGVHQNRAAQHSSKRNSFSANWDIQSSVTQETQDDGTSWGKDVAEEKQDGRLTRNSWDRPESTVTSIEPRRFMMNDRWDDDNKGGHEKNRTLQEPSERPTFRTHQYSKSAERDREKKHSVSTQNTEKIDGKLHYVTVCEN